MKREKRRRAALACAWMLSVGLVGGCRGREKVEPPPGPRSVAAVEPIAEKSPAPPPAEAPKPPQNFPPSAASVDPAGALAAAAAPKQAPEGTRNPAKDDGGPPDASAAESFEKLLAGMGVRFLPKERRLEISGWVNMQKGLVEVFACTPDGKTHESVVVLDCVPSGLHAGLLALGLAAGTPVEGGTEADYKPPAGPKVLVQVRWKDGEGKERTARAEEWVWNKKEEKPMAPAAWLFTGSFQQAVSGNPQETTYAANYIKSLVTTYHDASTILENPLPEGRDDTAFYANEKSVPPAGTPVTAVFSPAGG